MRFFLSIPSLRWRLVAVMCLAYVIVSVATEVLGYEAQSKNLQNQVAARARSGAQILAAGAVGNLSGSGTYATLQAFVASLIEAQSQGVAYAVVTGNENTVLASTVPSELHKRKVLPFVGHPTAFVLRNGDVEGVAPSVGQNTVLGLVEVRVSGASIGQDLRNALIVESLARGLGLLLFILLSLIIARYILGPLTTLARAARAIDRGELSSRVPATGRTELATVAEAFNDMAGALQQRIEHLSFLARTGPILPQIFRVKGEVTPILEEFCQRLDTFEAGLLLGENATPLAYFSTDPATDSASAPLRALARGVERPTAALHGGMAVMAVPLMGDMVFVTARQGGAPFSQEEREVITNFAYQMGVAAENARLFEAQQEALKVKDQFLSIVSHELRTPLTTIKGYAQMLGRKLEDDSEGRRFTDTIDAQVSRLSRLVDDLLDVTRFARGQFELSRQHMDIVPVLQDVVSRFRLVTPKHTLELEVDQGPLEGDWDHDRLEQVMNNLVSNAIKYSPNGGRITISTRHEGNDLVVAVADEGIGISREDQERLFERFFRGSLEGQDIKGLGLGLYVTQRIIEAHGGTIAVRSVPGEGSEFSVTLPLRAEQHAEKTAARGRSPATE